MNAEKLTLARGFEVYGVDGCEAIGTGWAVLPDVVVVPDGAAAWERMSESGARRGVLVALEDGRRILAKEVHISERGALALELPEGTLCVDSQGGLPGEVVAVLGHSESGGTRKDDGSGDFCSDEFAGPGMQAWAPGRHPSLWCRIFPRMSACR